MAQDSIDAARRRYSIPQWSEGFFDVDAEGHLVARPDGGDDTIALTGIASQARAQGLRLPLLVRFPDILRRRAHDLRDAFRGAIEATGYSGRYTSVYPVKVNQQASVVGTLASVDGMGLEAGSKPELITALAVAAPGRTIICNGYKDAPYIRLALSGRKLGLNVIIVIEKPGEWPLIRREARALGIDPVVGVRLRLSALGTGNWQNTGGERAKFGLNAMQLVELVETLREDEALDALELLHFHMGSQISNLRDIQHGVREAARYYAELHAAGVPIRCVDIGGGLGVDYEGGRSRTFCSMNYSVEQYAQAIVGGLGDLCRERELPMPDLVSESGRALTAHHAVLITNVTATERFPRGLEFALESDTHPVVVHLATLLAEVDRREAEECFLEAEHWLEEGRNLFLYGDLALSDRARLEPLYFAVLERVAERLDPDHRRHRELRERIRFLLSDKYFINLSIFQSLPDVWAIDQVFPIVPLQRLDESPTRRAVLEDLTCDSDGRIDQYVERGLLEPTLPVHEIRPGENYLLGVFMAGAYQETLGDIHNLFGDTDSVDVVRHEDGFVLRNARPGDTADSLLELVGYQPRQLLAACRAKVASAGLERAEADAIERLLTEGLSAYTYLETSG
ncbi:biosynthetic arginine decarboxylase [Wenzhouxiangella sp. XN79A]|uniref:biosynthetic arginine decarboxylase n=1 Tax=Wenzhouxiangella sp. XN79A TaxID=2724193 RepID=UPI00144A8586|nr:biosynthetic arginine decarboxylase [Wenzhouxiangella sp. XN79A]NKI33627.1 biosynthetic arginine decarboxylase [Wenzhouxiangella sp. XN79A]